MFIFLYVFGLVLPAMALDQVNYAAMRFMPSRYLYFHGFEYGQPSKYEFESVTHMGKGQFLRMTHSGSSRILQRIFK